jgi:hypothetical protein
VALGTQASLFLSSLKTDLKSLSDSSLPKQQAVLEIAKSAIDTYVNVFRYVAWASTGLNPATLNRLREQIGRDSMHVEAEGRCLFGAPLVGISSGDVEQRPPSSTITIDLVLRRAA